MKRLLLWLLAGLVAASGVYAAGVSLFGPGAEVRATFDRFKVAVATGDRATEAALLAPEMKEHFDRIRRHALRSDRAVVAALPFADRMAIFTLRRAVDAGVLRSDALRIAEPQVFYAAARAALPMGDPGIGKWMLWFVLPVGPAEAWGIADPTGLASFSVDTALMVLFGPVRFRFVKVEGRWLVDTTPLLLSSAGENEYYAVRLEPSGNQFIFNMFKADPAAVERLWRPLE